MNALRRVLDAPHPPPHYAVRLAYRTHAEEWGWWHLNLSFADDAYPRTAAGYRRAKAKKGYTANAKKHAPHVCQ